MNQENYQLLEKMIESVEPLIEEIVFVGGITTFLYLTEEVNDLRVTVDVDVIIDANVREFQRTESKLRSLGFQPDPELHCRYRKGELVLDLMPIDGKILGFSNRWYLDGMRQATNQKIGRHTIRILSLEHFFATKFEAFLGRGQGDFYSSKDIEDIVTVLAGRPGTLTELEEKKGDVLQYLKSQFRKIVSVEEFRQSVLGHLPRRSSVTAAQLLTDISSFAGN